MLSESRAGVRQVIHHRTQARDIATPVGGTCDPTNEWQSGPSWIANRDI